MEINVAKVSKSEGIEEKINLCKDLSGTEIDFNGEKLLIISQIEVDGLMISFEGEIRVSLNIVTDVKRVCSRCLDSYDEHICIDSVFTFVKEGTSVNDDEDVYYYKSDTIDIGEMVLGEIIAAMPMKPLCKGDCNGLCAICGKNKNIAKCVCKEDNIDPRLQVLSKLFQSK